MTAQTARNRRTADGTMMALGSGWGCPKPTRRGRSWKIGQTHGLGARFPQLSSSIAGMVHASKAELPRLSAAHWPTGAYRREDLPERVLQFGTGMLLRALCATFVDAANTAGTFSGRSVVIQSTPHGQARALNAQDGDRKSTRLNSSHSQISYAVFCLKKKKTTKHTDPLRRCIKTSTH